MAIRIPILTSFDPKGLKQANASFAQLQGSIGSLGRNFAVAGVAIGAVGAGLARTVQTASSYAESVNAVNVAFGKSAQGIIDFGKTAATTLGVSQVDFNNAAVRFSAFAERIVGSGGDASKFIAEISTRASDFASVFNIDVSEALQVFQSGLAGEAEPLKRFGVNLLDTEVKAYAVRTSLIKQGETMTEQEKVIARYGLLMESTAKTSGDFANTSDGLANQMRILKAEVSNTQIEIGNQLLPVMAELLPVVRDLVKDLGTQLVAAVKAVDWKALTTDLMNTARFFIENATAIAQVTVAIFAINTAYKTYAVVTGIAKVATDLYKYAVAKAAAGSAIATVSVNLLSTAMKLIPFVAVVAGLGLLVTAFTNTNTWAGKTESGIAAFGDKLQYAGGKAAVLVKNLNEIPKEVSTNISITAGYANAEARRLTEQAFGRGSLDMSLGKFDPKPEQKDGTPTTGKTSASKTFEQSITFGIKKATAQGTLQGFNFAQGYIDGILTSQGGLRQANKLINKVTKASVEDRQKIVNKANTRFAGTIGEVNRVAAENAARDASAAAQAASDLIAAQQAAAAAEAAALAERERVYNSFLDSVKNTFAGIKNAILGAFDLPQLGGSTNAITRNMDKLLVRLRSFADNVKQLAGMGLNPALLQQVISAGPMAGARLAESLVMGGAGALAAINAGYSEFGALSSQIAQTGTESLFNREAQQTVYNINVDGGVGSGSTIGKAIVDAIKAYERTSGAVWQGA